jgi:hypothetical protein
MPNFPQPKAISVRTATVGATSAAKLTVDDVHRLPTFLQWQAHARAGMPRASRPGPLLAEVGVDR